MEATLSAHKGVTRKGDALFLFLASATLQVMDVVGRVIRVCTDVARNVSTDGIPAGIYVLRLINGDDMKTQGIAID